MSMIVNMPVGGYPLAMYGMIALTTAVLAYATISSGSSDGADASAAKSGESMFSGLLGSSSEAKESTTEGSKAGIMDSLGSVGDMFSSSAEGKVAEPSLGGGSRKRKNRKTKNKRRKSRSEKRSASK